MKLGLVEKHTSLKEGGSNVKQETAVYPADGIAAQAAEDRSFITEYVSGMKSARQGETLKAAVLSPGATVGEIAETVRRRKGSGVRSH